MNNNKNISIKMKIINIEKKKFFTFHDHIKNGLKINPLMVIDFTSSNLPYYH